MKPKSNSLIVFVWALMVLALILNACGSPGQASDASDPKGTITISGAFALYPMMQRWAEEFQQLHPGIQFDVSAGGAGKGMADALAGIVDIGMVSRAISAEEESRGAYWVPVTKDAVLPMVNTQNPVFPDLLTKGVQRDAFYKIFISGEIKTWGEVVGRPETTEEIHVYTRSDAAGAPETWAIFLGKKQEDLLGVGVFGDPGLLEAVINDPLGIGFNNVGYAYDFETGEPVAGAMPLPLDINNNGQADPEEVLETKEEAVLRIATGEYPSPPARELNLVTNSKPAGIIQMFIAWVLTDGQQYVGEAGYVKLSQEQLDAALEKIR